MRSLVITRVRKTEKKQQRPVSVRVLRHQKRRTDPPTGWKHNSIQVTLLRCSLIVCLGRSVFAASCFFFLIFDVSVCGDRLNITLLLLLLLLPSSFFSFLLQANCPAFLQAEISNQYPDRL